METVPALSPPLFRPPSFRPSSRPFNRSRRSSSLRRRPPFGRPPSVAAVRLVCLCRLRRRACRGVFLVCLSAVFASLRPPSSVSSPALPAPRVAFSFFCVVSLALSGAACGRLLSLRPIRALSFSSSGGGGWFACCVAAAFFSLVLLAPPFCGRFRGGVRVRRGGGAPSLLPVLYAPPSLRIPCGRPLAAPSPCLCAAICLSLCGFLPFCLLITFTISCHIVSIIIW